MSTLVIEAIACRKDNYAYLVHDSERDRGDAYVVDPTDAEPVAQALRSRNLALRGILLTHHHADHVGGVEELARAHQLRFVAGFAGDRGRLPGQTVFVAAPRDRFLATELVLSGHQVLARHIPGHTRGAVAWGLAADAFSAPSDVFTGDTLFGAGCGRLFEGTAAEMYESLQALAALPPGTRLWFGHEYTAANLRFAETIEPDNAAVAARRAALTSRTTPTSVALERETNPFLRATSVEELAARRAAKDRF